MDIDRPTENSVPAQWLGHHKPTEVLLVTMLSGSSKQVDCSLSKVCNKLQFSLLFQKMEINSVAKIISRKRVSSPHNKKKILHFLFIQEITINRQKNVIHQLLRRGAFLQLPFSSSYKHFLQLLNPIQVI